MHRKYCGESIHFKFVKAKVYDINNSNPKFREKVDLVYTFGHVHNTPISCPILNSPGMNCT